MSPLNIHPEDAALAPKKKKNKTLKVLLGIAVLVAVPVVGTTLAASIGINTSTNNQIQFGQGVVQAVACDSSITVTAGTAFTNASTAGSFSLSTVTISDIDSTACNGKTFTIHAYQDTNATPLTVAAALPTPTPTSSVTTTALKVVFNSSGSHTLSEANANYTLGGTTTSIVVTLVTKPAATDVYKFTVESA